MPATFLSKQKMLFTKLLGKLMKNATNAALHRSKNREGPKERDISFIQFCCLPVGKQLLQQR